MPTNMASSTWVPSDAPRAGLCAAHGATTATEPHAYLPNRSPRRSVDQWPCTRNHRVIVGSLRSYTAYASRTWSAPQGPRGPPPRPTRPRAAPPAWQAAPRCAAPRRRSCPRARPRQTPRCQTWARQAHALTVGRRRCLTAPAPLPQCLEAHRAQAQPRAQESLRRPKKGCGRLAHILPNHALASTAWACAAANRGPHGSGAAAPGQSGGRGGGGRLAGRLPRGGGGRCGQQARVGGSAEAARDGRRRAARAGAARPGGHVDGRGLARRFRVGSDMRLAPLTRPKASATA